MFQAFVVVVGFLMLAGAVNTAIVGSNGVLNRVSEDGVLTDWFRKPHRKYGTTYRLINLITVLQLFTIVVSRGNVYVLGEAYAFGVVWSFAFKSLAMFVLRYKQPDAPTREWKVPLNPKIGGRELPVGLGLITVVLFAVAVINLFTKQTATISGVIFTLLFYAVFVVSERAMHKRRAHARACRAHRPVPAACANRTSAWSSSMRAPGGVLVPVRDYNTLTHLDRVVHDTDTEQRDIVVLTIRLLTGPDAGVSDIEREELFTDYEQTLFTRVVAIAERHGRAVKLLVVPSTNVFDAVAQTAVRLQAREIVDGRVGQDDGRRPGAAARRGVGSHAARWADRTARSAGGQAGGGGDGSRGSGARWWSSGAVAGAVAGAIRAVASRLEWNDRRADVPARRARRGGDVPAVGGRRRPSLVAMVCFNFFFLPPVGASDDCGPAELGGALRVPRGQPGREQLVVGRAREDRGSRGAARRGGAAVRRSERPVARRRERAPRCRGGARS